ncbi:MAG: cytochrome d terminal oxidase subunit 1, partial [Caulobacter vibrioides]
AGVAKRSMTVAAAFGLASSLSVVVLGDESGYALTDNQKMKLAALEAMWETEPAPAGLAAFGIPSMADRKTHYEVKIPYVLGLIATRSLDKPVEGIFELVAKAEDRIESGVIAYGAVEALKANPNDVAARATFEQHRRDLGYGLLLKRYVADPRQASPDLIKKTAWDVVPPVPVMFWSFRIMAGPTFLGASSLSVPQLLTSIAVFTLLYGALAVVEVGLILKTIKRGPYALHDPAPDGSPEPEAAVA